MPPKTLSGMSLQKGEKDNEYVEALKISTENTRFVQDMNNPIGYYAEIQKDQLKRYTTEAAQKENERIRYLTEESSIKGKLDNLDRARLQNVQNRNSAFILLNDQKLGGDSTLMDAVKKSVEELERDLLLESNFSSGWDEVIDSFDTAIKACKKYIEAKNPRFEKGKKRKQMVQEQLLRLEEEKRLFESGLKFVAEDLKSGKMDLKNFEIINKGREMDADISAYCEETVDRFEKAEKSIESILSKEKGGQIPEDVSLNEEEQKFLKQTLKDTSVYVQGQKNKEFEKNMMPEIENEKAIIYYSKKDYTFTNTQRMKQMDNDYAVLEKRLSSGDFYIYADFIREILGEYQSTMLAADHMEFALQQIIKKRDGITDKYKKEELSEAEILERLKEEGFTENVQKKIKYYEDSLKILYHRTTWLFSTVYTMGKSEPLVDEQIKVIPQKVAKAYEKKRSENES